MNVGMIVAKYRNSKGLTQEELAERVGVSRSAIARLEKDCGKPGFDIMVQIAKELGCSLDEFVKGA